MSWPQRLLPGKRYSGESLKIKFPADHRVPGMKKNIAPESGLKDLSCLTDEAIACAQTNNIAAVRSCMKMRRHILEGLDIINEVLNGREEMRDLLCRLLKKDEELQIILKDRLNTAQKDQHKFKKSRALRQRFTSRRARVPRFIDKKA